MSNFNFDELTQQAREFEKGTTYVRKKLSEFSKFGRGDKAAKTLYDMKEELACFETSCLEALNVEKQHQEHISQRNREVTSTINKLWTNLGVIENKWKAFDYKPCPLTDHLVDDSSLSSDGSLEVAEVQNGDASGLEPRQPMRPVATSSERKVMPNGQDNRLITPFGIRSRLAASREQFCSPILAPEMSNLTMEILGRSAKVNKSRRKLY